MSNIQAQNSSTFDALKDTYGYTNVFQAPRVVKIVVSTGTGSVQDQKKRELIGDRLARITGQKPAPRGSRQSIASFKLREGDMVGYQVTLRGRRMQHFLDRLIKVAFPRTKDFQGVSKNSVDEMGNISIGIAEHTIFPEVPEEELRDVFGFSVTLVTTASTKEEATALFEHIGIPFRKE